MTFTIRQKTGTADTACVTMLCMVSTMLLGFSSPQHARGPAVSPAMKVHMASESMVADPFKAPESDWVELPSAPTGSGPLNAPDTDLRDVPAAPDMSKLANVPNSGWVDLSAKAFLPRSKHRPFSFATNEHIEPVLGGVSSRRWFMPSVYSPDRAVADQNRFVVGKFHGVGFPDITTYRKAKRSPFDAPGKWAPLVAWRTLQGEDALPEPIARVRCMGLSPQAVARRADRYKDMIYTYAETYAVSPHLVKAVITVESCFNNKALSPVGAQGLMQLMPETATWLKVKDSHDPAQNLRGGVKYLASLQKEFHSTELALAAYNAGPGNVRRYNGVPPFAETLAYVVKVQSHYRRYKAAHRLRNPVEDSFEQVSNAVVSR